jgi:hypothetical protein
VTEILSRRALNRATLARQLLLERAPMPALDAVHHLVGMQAQVPLNPYTGLWSRLAGFRAAELAQLLVDRRLVRIVVMRATIHLVTPEDCLTLRPLMQPILVKELAHHRDYAPALVDADLDPVLAFAAEALAASPRTGAQLRKVLGERFPDLDAGALAYACRCLLALVQVPPRGVWGQAAQVTVTTAEAWLGRPLAADPSIDDVMLRYLGAFGPASVADASTWSRLTGLRQVFERLRPQLVTFRDERGRELFDLPDAPRPGAGVAAAAPVRPHDDRSRFGSDEERKLLYFGPEPVHGAVLSDGFVKGTWAVDGSTLHVRHTSLDPDARKELEAEGLQLLQFLGLPAGDVRLSG